MTEEVKRGPGRPKAEPLKKGNSSWQPASVTDVLNKEPGYRYRILNKDPDNLAKKQAEGWEILSGVASGEARLTDTNRIEDGKQLTSTYERRDVILGRMPEETAQERDKFFNDKTARQTQGLTSHLKKEVREGKGNVGTHGEITISSRKGEQVFE